MRKKPAFVVALCAVTALSTVRAWAVEPTYYGEPIKLRSNFIYFTSWKYVRQGGFAWHIQPDANAGESAAWMQGDGSKPATFEMVDMPMGVRLVAQRAEKVPFKPGQMAAQVFDEGKYKAWYTVSPCSEPEPFSTKDKILPGHNVHIAYAESEDGLAWTKPTLGLYEYAGNRDNNIVYRTDVGGLARGWHGGCVFIDPTSTDERYKMIYLGIISDEEWAAFEAKYPGQADTMARRPNVGEYRLVFGVFGAVSPDGLHWTTLPEPLMIQHADTMNTCYYDLDRKQYVAYVRAWQVNERAPGYGAVDDTSWIDVGRRCIGRSVSDDFRHFSKPEIVLATKAGMPPNHLFYTNGKTTLPGCPDNHVMFPWIWELERDGGSTWLYSSADGWSFSEVPGGPVVTLGAPGKPDGCYIVCNGNLLEYPGDKWCMPYGANPIPHKYPGRDIQKRKGLFPGVPSEGGLATWPKGRLVALQCDEDGQFATVAVIPPTDRIRLNAIVPPTGYIQVSVNRFGKGPVQGRSFDATDRFIGDELAAPVTWNGEASLGAEGEPVILRFRMRQAKLFGIEFY